MEYTKVKPYKELVPFIHFYWELRGSKLGRQWERVFPDGCAGIVMNMGDRCLTDNGLVSMEFGKTYVVGAMTSFKDSLIESDTYLLGVCFKPAAFTNFYEFVSQYILTNDTVELERPRSFNVDKIRRNRFDYVNHFLSDRMRNKKYQLQAVISDIYSTNGNVSVYDLSKRHFTTVRQLERCFKEDIGLSPKKYCNIIRFQNALNIIRNSDEDRSLSDIAFECGYYDHSHLTNDIKRHSGLVASQL